MARQEGIEGMDESVREVKRAAGYREEAIEQRKREGREREEKAVELEQAIDEQERALDQRGSRLECSKRVEELQEE